MTVADLIAELSRLPGHLPVAVGLDGPVSFADEEGEHELELTWELDSFGLSEVRNEGRVAVLIGGGMHWETI